MHDLLSHDTTRTLRLARYSNPRDAQTTRRDAERDAHTHQSASTCTAHTSRRTSHISPTNTHFERLLAATRCCARALQKRCARACATPRCLQCRAMAARRAAADARGRPPQPSCHRDTHDRRVAIAPLYFLLRQAHKTCAFFPISFLGRAPPVLLDFPTWPPCAGRLSAQAPPASAHCRKTRAPHRREA